MEPVDESSIILAFLNGLEIATLLAVILVLFGGKYLNDLKRGLGQGVIHFRRQIDEIGEEAGRTVGYNYAKPVFEALTPNNEAVEFHDQRELKWPFFRWWKRARSWFQKIRAWFRRMRP